MPIFGLSAAYLGRSLRFSVLGMPVTCTCENKQLFWTRNTVPHTSQTFQPLGLAKNIRSVIGFRVQFSLSLSVHIFGSGSVTYRRESTPRMCSRTENGFRDSKAKCGRRNNE